MDNRVAPRYAEALFSLALETKNVESWQQQMKTVSEVFKMNPSLEHIFYHVQVDKEEKKELIETGFSSLDKELVNFLKLLVDKGRINYLLDISKEFNHLCNENRGIVEGIVYSPYELNEKEVTRIEDAISKKLNKNVELTYRKDVNLILGIRIEIDGHIIDGSVKNQIQKMKETLLEVR